MFKIGDLLFEKNGDLYDFCVIHNIVDGSVIIEKRNKIQVCRLEDIPKFYRTSREAVRYEG